MPHVTFRAQDNGLAFDLPIAKIWAWSAVAGLLMVLVSAVRDVDFAVSEKITFAQAMRIESVVFAYWVIWMPVIIWCAAHLPSSGRRWMATIPALLGIYAVLCAGYVAWVWRWNGMYGGGKMSLMLTFRNDGRFYYTNSMLKFYIPAMVGTYVYLFYARAKRQELQAIRLAEQLSSARLQALTAQLRPHFLFNALNSIAALIHSEPERADKMLTELSDLLRIVLRNESRDLVTLRSELDLTKKYLSIQQMRFSDRLETNIEVPETALECAIPQLLLQPLVENVIKHAVSRTSAMVTLRLRAEERNGDLLIQIEDNGPAANGTQGTGLGLRNLRERLEHLYGNRAGLELGTADGYKKVTVRVPRSVMPEEVAHESRDRG